LDKEGVVSPESDIIHTSTLRLSFHPAIYFVKEAPWDVTPPAGAILLHTEIAFPKWTLVSEPQKLATLSLRELLAKQQQMPLRLLLVLGSGRWELARR